jgi:hypothetical protein
MSPTLADEPQSIGGVLDRALRLFRGGVGPALPYSAVAALAAGAMQFSQLLSQADQLGAAGAGLPRIPRGAAVAIMLVCYLVLFLCSSALFVKFNALASGVPARPWRQALARAPASFGNLLLFGLGGIVAAVPLIVATVLLKSQLLVAVALGLVGVALLLYVFVRASFGWIDTVVRPSGPLEGLKNSWRITRGSFWRVSVVTTVYGILIAVLYAIVIGGLQFALGMTGLIGRPGAVLGTMLVGLAIVTLAVQPLTAATWTSLWYDLRVRTEGVDLAARIDALSPAA